MKLARCFGSACLVFCSVVAVSPAQEVEEEQPGGMRRNGMAAEKPPAHPAEFLPEPLEHVETNLPDLETDGYFQIGRPRFATIDNGLYDAIVWQVRVARPITYRHVTMFLDKYRDARFYRTANDRLQEVHITMLFYSPRIEARAGNRQLLAEDDLFEVWIYLNPEETRKVVSLKADVLTLSPKRR